MIPVTYHETNIQVNMAGMQRGHLYILCTSRYRGYPCLARFSGQQLADLFVVDKISVYLQIVKELTC